MDLLRSLPLGLYLEQPVTWLHHLDSRVKFIWLMSFLLAPLVDNPYWRLSMVVVLILLTVSAAIPWRVWRNQMGWLLVVAGFVFLLSAIAPDGFAINPTPRLPASITLPQPTDYHYVLWSAGPAVVTRRSLDLAVRVSTLLFTLIYSTNLFLLTTAPEEITAGLESLMRPLRRFNWPVTEITLTLTLSLRFIPLVLEEVQNLVRSVRTRAINWKKLGIRKSLQVWLMVSERLLENLLLRAEQIASAMTVRGFTSPSQHRVQWHQLRLGRGDWVAIVLLFVFWGIGLGWTLL
jgi:energy-coupling factor transport system permease protein